MEGLNPQNKKDFFSMDKLARQKQQDGGDSPRKAQNRQYCDRSPGEWPKDANLTNTLNQNSF
jgi:hypothetical protein